MALTQPCDFDKFNPFRRPDWRHERVLSILARLREADQQAESGLALTKTTRTRRRDDQHVKAYRLWLARYQALTSDTARNELVYENPGLFWAFQIFTRRHEDAKNIASIFEARLLARCHVDVIADEQHTLPETVEWYERLFFNVSDRLHAHDWIVDKVLVPAYDAMRRGGEWIDGAPGQPGYRRRMLAEPLFDCTVKFFAYFGGPTLLDYVLTGFRRGALVGSQDDIVGWFDGHATTRLRHRSAAAAATFEVNRYNVMQLFDTHARLIELSQSAAAKRDGDGSLHARGVAGLLGGLQWAIGDDGARQAKGKPTERFDNGAAELRADEQMLVAAKQSPGTIDGVPMMRLPPRPSLSEVDENGARLTGDADVLPPGVTDPATAALTAALAAGG